MSGRSREAAAIARELEAAPLPELLARAAALTREGHGLTVSYSKKVFIPLTQLCRDTCGYCTFAKAPRRVDKPFLAPDDVLAIARAGQAAGCKEALFTLGDKPELRYASARSALDALGFATTLDYLAHACKLVHAETGLLPHVNAGVMGEADLARLRAVSVSQGLMLEGVSPRLLARGGAHFGSPDKDPAVRIAMMEAAGRQCVPFTSGILIGIGETFVERIEALLALRDLHRTYGHLQEIIVQNFRAKPGTRMVAHAEPPMDDLLRTVAAARIVLGPDANIQAPPNLSSTDYVQLLDAGINDWGGVSPVTIDHVNPEAPWPALDALARATRSRGHTLVERLAVYPEYALRPDRWQAPELVSSVLAKVDASGLARTDPWTCGRSAQPPAVSRGAAADPDLPELLRAAGDGAILDEADIVRLFEARDGDVDLVCEAADALRAKACGDTVRYVVNRNINYTNVCTYKCGFCAFSKGSTAGARGKAYDLSLAEVARRAREAYERGATEVCLQGGINPHYTGDTYLSLLRAVKDAVPQIHVHAFSPLEVHQGALTLGISVHRFLERLQAAGLGSLPGTSAEILDDEVRRVICPDKLTTRQWLDVVAAAHGVGFRTTATIMFGHVDRPVHWARHLARLRDLQRLTGGLTEFVPLPFVYMEAPMALRGLARTGPTWREVRLMHAVARLVLHPIVPHIQASWVKLGAAGAAAMLRSGADDLGGTLMNESISRAAGSSHGQELDPAAIEGVIVQAGRRPAQRTTLYGTPPAGQQRKSFGSAPLTDVVNTPFIAAHRRAAADRARTRHDS